MPWVFFNFFNTHVLGLKVVANTNNWDQSDTNCLPCLGTNSNKHGARRAASSHLELEAVGNEFY